MSEIINTNPNIQNNYMPVNNTTSNNDAQKPDLNIDAHYSNNMKVVRAKKTANYTPANLPLQHLFSSRDADIKMRQISTDIYESAKKEGSNRDFDKKLYFKIFCGVTLTTAIIACIRRFRR